MKQTTPTRFSTAAATFFAALSLGQAQSLVLPQIVDGGGWQTTIVLTNTGSSPTSANIAFFAETGGGATQSWTPPLLEGTTQTYSLAAAGTLLLHTSGTAASATVGWAAVLAGSPVTVYAIVTQQIAGGVNQLTTVPGAVSATRVLIPFDNTNGNVSSIVMVNPTAPNELVFSGIQPTSGATFQPAPINLPAHGHVAFSVPQQFPSTKGKSGLLELSTPGAGISVLALRTDPSGALVATPAYSAAGGPILGASGGPPSTGTLPDFDQLTITPTPLLDNPSVGQLGIVGINVQSRGDGTYFGTASGFPQSVSTIATFVASWRNVQVTNRTLTFNDVDGTSRMQVGDQQVPITTATLMVTLTPQGQVTSGTVSGSIRLVSALATVEGNFSGTYTLTQ